MRDRPRATQLARGEAGTRLQLVPGQTRTLHPCDESAQDAPPPLPRRPCAVWSAPVTSQNRPPVSAEGFPPSSRSPWEDETH